MLFIDHDQTEIVQRGKKGRTSTDHHLRSALAYLMPGFSPRRHGLTTMQYAQPDTPPGQTPAKTCHGLRGERDFRHQNNRVSPLLQNGIQRLQVNLRLSTSRDTLQQDRSTSLLLFSLLIPLG
jgi:hypothetical protein